MGFSASDVTLTGATPGAWTGQDGDSVYTLTVTPTPNTNGSIQVAVNNQAAQNVHNIGSLPATAPDLAFDTLAPTISAVSVANGTYRAGNTASITLTAANAETRLTLKSGSSFNGQTVTGFTDNHDGTYTVSYTAQAGDADVADGGSVATNLVLVDAAGNESAAITTVTLSGESIDAHAPTISAVAVANGTYRAGNTASITLTAANAETGLSLKSGSSFNGQTVTGFTDNHDGTYTVSYAVQAGDTDVTDGGSVATNLVLVDAAGNVSAAITTVTLSGESIDANKPVISSVTVANGAYKLGDAVSITITAANNEAGLLLGNGQLFNGRSITNFTDLGNGTYTARYTVLDGDTDVADGGVVATNLSLKDAAGNNGLAVTGVTLNDQSIDAHLPGISSVNVADGIYKVGDSVAITLTATGNETGLTLKSGSSFSGHNVTSFTDNHDGTYTVHYTVLDGDTDVADGGVVAADLTLQDAAGNLSATITDVTLSGESIHAHPPVINIVAVADGSHKVGSTVAITLTEASSTTGLVLKSGGTFNGHAVTGFTDNHNGTYTVSYAVQAGDADVADGGSVATNLVLMDAAGNESAAVTTVTLSGESIDAHAPAISSVAVTNGTYKVSSTASITLTAAGNETGLTLKSGSSFNGQTVTGFTDNHDGTYTVSYTAQAGDADVADGGSVATNLVLVDAAGNESAAITTVTLSGESIDANAPTISAVSVTNGTYKVSSTASITLTAANAETGLSLKSGSSFNGQTVTGFTDNHDGTYTVSYAVQAGDTDVADGGSAAADLVLVDAVGNESAAITAVTLSGESIDANAPGIDYVDVQNGTYKVGSTASITLTAANAQTGLTLKSGSSFNGQTVTGFTDNHDGTYTVSYTVQAGDTDVAIGGSVATNLVLVDAAGNESAAVTSVTLSGESIDAHAPTISSVAVANGAYKANDVVVITLTAANAETDLSLKSGSSFNGQTVVSFVDHSDGTYTVSYVVQSSDTSVADGANAVANLVLVDAAGNESAAITSVTLSGESIDTQAPAISGVAVANGAYKAGSTASITLTAANAETGLTLKSGSSFNGQTVTGFTDNQDGTYTVSYTAQAGDADVADGANAMANLVLVDAAGNESTAVTEVTLSGEFIDTHAPGISNVATASGRYRGGSVIAITLTASNSETGLTLKSGSSFNGHAVTGFTDNHDGTYTVNYTVQVSDADVATGGSVNANLVLKDAAGNESTAITSVTLTNTVIDTTAPTITISQVAGDDLINTSEKTAGITVQGTTTAENNQTVTLTWGTLTKTAQVLNGAWTISVGTTEIPDNGSYTLSAAVSDLAGNPATAATRSVTVNAVVPTISLSTPLTNGADTPGDADAILNANELAAITTAGHWTLSGATTNAANNSTVTLTLNSRTYTAQVSSNAWSINVPKDDVLALAHGNSYGISATVTNTNGDTSAASTSTLDVRTYAPDVPTVNLLKTSNASAFDVTGQALKASATTPGDYIALETGDQLSVTITKSVNGQAQTIISRSLTLGTTPPTNDLSYDTATKKWTLNMTTLSEGVYDVSVSVNSSGYASPKTDASSNELQVRGPATVTIDDVTGDNTINISEHTGQITISGTVIDTDLVTGTNAAVGRSLTLTVQGVSYTTSIDSQGAWRYTLPGATVSTWTDAGAITTTYDDIFAWSADNNKSFAIDLSRPTVSQASLGDKSETTYTQLNAGDTVYALLDFSESVFVNGTPSIKLQIGSDQVTANYVSAVDADTVKFSYQILPNQTAASGIGIVANSLTLGTASIVDAHDNALNSSTFTAVAPNSNYIVDTTAPTLTLSALSLGTDLGPVSTDFITNTGSQTLSATLGAALGSGEHLWGSVNNGSSFTDITNKVSTTTLTWDNLALTGSNTLQFKVIDAAGNVSSLAGSTNYTIDTTAPTLATSNPIALTAKSESTYTALNADDVVTATVNFSEAVYLSGTATLKLNVGGTLVDATCTGSDADSGSGTSALKFKYTILSTQNDTDGISIDANSLSLNSGATLTDIGGNTLSTMTHSAVAANSAYKVDNTVPTIAFTSLIDNYGTSATTAYTTATVTTDDPAPTFRVNLAGSGLAMGDTLKLLKGGVEETSVTLTSTNITNNYVDITSSANIQYNNTGTGHAFSVQATDSAGNQFTTGNFNVKITTYSLEQTVPGPTASYYSLTTLNGAATYPTSASTGKMYGLLSINNDNAWTKPADLVTHDVLDNIFNNGNNTWDATANRSTSYQGVTFTLPTRVELSNLLYDARSSVTATQIQSLYSSVGGTTYMVDFWSSSNTATAGNHYYLSLQTTSGSSPTVSALQSAADTTARYALVMIG